MLGVFLKRTSSESKKTLKNLSLKKNEKKNLKTPDHGFWLTGFLFSVLLLTGEGLLLRKLGWPRHDSMYITLPLVLWCLMRLLLAGKRERTHREKRLGRECRTFAAAFYVVHPLMIVCGAWRREGDRSCVKYCYWSRKYKFSSGKLLSCILCGGLSLGRSGGCPDSASNRAAPADPVSERTGMGGGGSGGISP